jgi:hypothetical protein
VSRRLSALNEAGRGRSVVVVLKAASVAGSSPAGERELAEAAGPLTGVVDGWAGLVPVACSLVGRYVGRTEHLWVPQVEGAQVGHEASVVLLGRLLCLDRRLLFEAPGVLLGAEVDNLGKVTWPVSVLGHRHAENVRRVPGQGLLAGYSADHARQVITMALDNPHEAGLLSAAILVEVDLGGVVDDDPSKVLGCIAPPLALLRPITVATSLGLGSEADHGHAPAVIGDPRRGTEPAVGIGGELTLPATQIPADPGWVGRPTLDDPNEHELLPFPRRIPKDARSAAPTSF